MVSSPVLLLLTLLEHKIETDSHCALNHRSPTMTLQGRWKQIKIGQAMPIFLIVRMEWGWSLGTIRTLILGDQD